MRQAPRRAAAWPPARIGSRSAICCETMASGRPAIATAHSHAHQSETRAEDYCGCVTCRQHGHPCHGVPVGRGRAPCGHPRQHHQQQHRLRGGKLIERRTRAHQQGCRRPRRGDRGRAQQPGSPSRSRGPASASPRRSAARPARASRRSRLVWRRLAGEVRGHDRRAAHDDGPRGLRQRRRRGAGFA